MRNVMVGCLAAGLFLGCGEEQALPEAPDVVHQGLATPTEGPGGGDPTAWTKDGYLYTWASGRDAPHRYVGGINMNADLPVGVLTGLSGPNGALPDSIKPNDFDAANPSGVWAPSVRWNTNDNRYVMWFSGKTTGTCGGRQKGIWRAIANNAGDDFSPTSQTAVCPDGSDYSIDPYIAGTYQGPYLYVKSGTGIIRRKLNDGYLTFESGTAWQNVIDRTVGSWECNDFTGNCVIENPALVKVTNGGTNQDTDFRFVLFYSGNSVRSNAYSTGYADCGDGNSLKATCTKKHTGSTSWMNKGNTGLYGPGGASFFEHNGKDYMIHHAWSTDCSVNWDGTKRKDHWDGCSTDTGTRTMRLWRVDMTGTGSATPNAGWNVSRTAL